jgi:DNA-binding MarR family transcriptional regulator
MVRPQEKREEQLAGRAELSGQLIDLMRQASAYGLLVHQTIADQLGLIPTDLKCLDAARSEPQLTAGRLAELTGLSTSATTAALDRLERRGFVSRVRDESDRRRVFVESTGRHEAEVARLFAPLTESSRALLADYDEEQLALLLDFVTKLNEANRAILTQPSLEKHAHSA